MRSSRHDCRERLKAMAEPKLLAMDGTLSLGALTWHWWGDLLGSGEHQITFAIGLAVGGLRIVNLALEALERVGPTMRRVKEMFARRKRLRRNRKSG